MDYTTLQGNVLSTLLEIVLQFLQSVFRAVNSFPLKLISTSEKDVRKAYLNFGGSAVLKVDFVRASRNINKSLLLKQRARMRLF